MLSSVLTVPEPGQLVDVRQRHYVVMDTMQSVLPPDLLKSGNGNSRAHLVTLSSVDAPAINRSVD